MVWKMSLPAHPLWIFQVIAPATGVTVVVGPVAAAPVPPVVGDAAGAFCDRHDARNAARPEKDAYFRNPRRVEKIPTDSPPPTVSRDRALIRFLGIPPVKPLLSVGGKAR
jgi:hypothetical protein